jgi:DNA polymerase-3 subunit alpha
VISPVPLTDLVPLASFKGGAEGVTTQYDMKGVERIGLLKMDFLGLRTLTLIDNCVKMIAAQTGERLEIDLIRTDDPRPTRCSRPGAPAACSSSSRTACATS